MNAPGADRIELRGLRVFGYHGVFDQERRDGQEFLVDLTVWTDIRAAAACDELERTVDYGALAELAARIVAGPPRRLIETVATEIVEQILEYSQVQGAEVVLHKPSAPIPHRFADVRVVTTRYREQVAE